MPGPLIAKPQIPSWADPQGASVFDVPGQGLLRKVVGLLGLDDPNQVMAFGTPLEVGANTGGVLDALAQRFPRFANAIKAYHGSPHDFEKFDTSKIGTGEGAQAYGHGLYFAENEKVAQGYRNELSQPTVEIMGQQQPVPSWSPDLSPQPRLIRRLADARAKQPTADESQIVGHVRQALQQELSKSRLSDAERNHLVSQAEILDAAEARGVKTATGKMYEVAIKAHPDQFLDWDKPLSQQSAAVQKAFADVGALTPTDGMELAGGGKLRVKSDPDFGPKYFLEQGGKQFRLAPQDVQALIGTGVEGKSAYQALVNKLGSQTAATESLKQAGIPGLKYLDQGSRAKATAAAWESDNGWVGVTGHGEEKRGFPSKTDAMKWAEANSEKLSRNYVVFDDATVEILRKYGILPPVVGATLAGQQANQQPQP